jgi:hypothetical protein
MKKTFDECFYRCLKFFAILYELLNTADQIKGQDSFEQKKLIITLWIDINNRLMIIFKTNKLSSKLKAD